MRLHAVNTMGTVAVTEAMRDGGARRAAAVHQLVVRLWRREPRRAAGAESQPLRPVTPYGASKAAAEEIVWQFARQTGAEVIVTRAFQHTGPGHTGEYAMADWARQLAEIERARRRRHDPLRQPGGRARLPRRARRRGRVRRRPPRSGTPGAHLQRLQPGAAHDALAARGPDRGLRRRRAHRGRPGAPAAAWTSPRSTATGAPCAPTRAGSRRSRSSRRWPISRNPHD